VPADAGRDRVELNYKELDGASEGELLGSAQGEDGHAHTRRLVLRRSLQERRGVFRNDLQTFEMISTRIIAHALFVRLAADANLKKLSAMSGFYAGIVHTSDC
jgi:hypothetical protein